MFTAPCSMGVYFCTLLTRRVRMESSGKLRPTLICLASVSQLHTYFWRRLDSVWFCSVLYEVFPMSFLMEQAGGQSFTGKERVGFLLLFIFFRNSRNNFVFLSTLRVQFAAKHADTLALAGSWSGPNHDPREVPGIPRQLRRRGRDQSIVRRTGKDKLGLIRASYEV